MHSCSEYVNQPMLVTPLQESTDHDVVGKGECVYGVLLDGFQRLTLLTIICSLIGVIGFFTVVGEFCAINAVCVFFVSSRFLSS